MTQKLFKDISASTVQVITTQVLGLVVFLLTSLYLPKEVYGELNWSYAVLVFITTVLSLRLEQIVVKKAAIDKDSSKIMTLFMIHVLLSGIGFYLILFVLSKFFPPFFVTHNFLLVIGISQLLSFFTLPFKNVANGKERFGYLAIMSSTSFFIRVIWLTIMIVFFQLTVQWVLIIFIASAFIELLVCFFLVNNRMRIKFSSQVRFADYAFLLRESLPQIGVAVLMAGISRTDWILLGLFSTADRTAEYSFAYRVYELCPFPLLIIAPILLSRFAKYFATNSEQILLQQKDKLSLFIRSEMILATLIPLILNIVWIPLIDSLTANKYGAVNQTTFFILSCCIPFQYISNMIWSANFAQHRMKLILKITLVTFSIILAGDLFLIPFFDVKGAALVYLLAMIIEYLNYMWSSTFSKIKETWQSLLVCMIAATASGFAAFFLLENVYWRLAFALPVYSLLLLATRQLRINDIIYVLQSIKKNSSTADSTDESNIPVQK